MGTPETTTVYGSREGRSGGPGTIVTAVIAVALIAIAVALFSLASAVKAGNCIAEQSAKYPAIGVSAFNTKTTGPIKVAYDAERRKAIEANC